MVRQCAHQNGADRPRSEGEEGQTALSCRVASRDSCLEKQPMNRDGNTKKTVMICDVCPVSGLTIGDVERLRSRRAIDRRAQFQPRFPHRLDGKSRSGTGRRSAPYFPSAAGVSKGTPTRAVGGSFNSAARIVSSPLRFSRRRVFIRPGPGRFLSSHVIPFAVRPLFFLRRT